jgi:hypothetical protein
VDTAKQTIYFEEVQMKRKLLIAVMMLAILLGLPRGAAAKPLDGWSSITIWAFVDNDRNGSITPGDLYLHEIGACLTHKQAHTTFCGATDFGDVWWEPLAGGTFVARIDALDADLPAGLRLKSITCHSTIPEASGKDCTTWVKKGMAQFKQVPEEFTNIYFGFVPGP